MQPQGDRPVVISFRLNQLLGWVITAVACLVPVIIWLFMEPLSQRFVSPTVALLSIGKLAGLVGLVMYALNLIYATRLRFLENWFGGLNRVYIAHHLLGGLALILLCLHPLFLALRYGTNSIYEAAIFLLPHGLSPAKAFFNPDASAHVGVLQQWAILFGMIAFWGMVVLLIITFFIKLPYRVWLFTHKFLGVAFFFAGLHVLFISSDTADSAPLKYYLLSIAALGILAFIYRTLLGRILIRRYQYYVDEVKVVGGNVTQLTMRPVKQRMTYKPGQFIFIRFLFSGADKVTHEWHPFSISSTPTNDRLQISVKALGDYTSALTGLKQGAIAEVEGAYGKFSFTNYRNLNQIWVAGGIGITPFLSMAQSLPDKDFKIDLYYSVKTATEAVDWQKLASIAQVKNGNFRLIPYVKDQMPDFLNATYIEKMSGGLGNKEVFICGPPPMMKALRQQFRDKGVMSSMIHTEEFAMS